MKYYNLLVIASITIGALSSTALANNTISDNNDNVVLNSESTLLNINNFPNVSHDRKKSTFTGFYVGLGINANHMDYHYQSTAKNNNFKQNKYGLSLLLGYGYQFKNNLYLGAEGQLSYYPNNSASSNILNLPANEWGNFYVGLAPKYSFSLHLLPGYVYHSFLFYGVIGTSLTSYNNQFGYHASQWNKNNKNGHDSVYLQNQVSALALDLGLGIKYKLMQHMILGLEYDYTYSAPISMNRYGPGNANEYIQPKTQSINFNINYLF
ncbi:MAG: hypothetical protein EP298_06870 [Gammaproteobacteria bacterium]|nr:MAG: hypothetical protein EP298_06870 [Gammaproteobacteria bacterium]UTW42955.1 outer membrane beta-barrel protein [bacterium SCSIO 12844]